MTPTQTHLFDKPHNVRRLLWVFYACCALSLALEFVFHRHVEHPWEQLWGFYGLFGFVACVALVLIARQMRRLIMRAEDYYSHDGDDA